MLAIALRSPYMAIVGRGARIETVQAVVGNEWEEFFGGEGGLPRRPSRKIETALVSAASGLVTSCALRRTSA
jgi:hypothetical protein